jgi:hypothetical protein
MKLVFVWLLFFPFLLLSQQLKKVVVKNEDGVVTERYSVVKAEQSVKHGEYFQFSEDGSKVFECTYYHGDKQGIAVFYDKESHKIQRIGIYSIDKRIGIWEFYREGELVHKFNYTTGKLLVNKNEQVKKTCYVFNDEGIPTDEVVDVNPVYLGGYELLNQFVKENLLLTYVERENKIAVTVLITLTISSSSEIIDYKVKSTLNDANNGLVIRAFERMPNYWVPAEKDGVKVTTAIEIPIIIMI